MKETYKIYLQYRKGIIKGLSILGYYNILVINSKRKSLGVIIVCDILLRIIIVNILYYEIITIKGFNNFYKSLTLLIIILEFKALIYIIIKNNKTHIIYWERKISIISKSSNNIKVIGEDKYINLYVIHHNIIDTYEALKYLMNNNYYIKKTHIMICYYYFLSWFYCLLFVIRKLT